MAHLCTSLQFVTSPSDSYYWWMVCILRYNLCSILLLSEFSLNDWLKNIHPSPVEIVCDVTDWCFGLFLHISYNVSAINCCCFPWSTCSMSVAQYASGFFLFQNIPSCCTKLSPMLLEWLWFLLFSKLCKLWGKKIQICHLVYIFWPQTQLSWIWNWSCLSNSFGGDWMW